MGTLAGRRIVLGVCGGIAAYKAIEVCRRLVDAGAHVVPVMTAGATRFVGEVTFSALASEPVQTSLWDEASPIPHTQLGQSADLVLVCPATARVLADYRTGRSGDLLTATLLATRAPVVVCPAMHTEMWEHPAVQDNLTELARRGVRVVPPESGRLAGGDIGTGRLAAPEAIVAAVESVLAGHDLSGLRVVVTAGGTREAIDPVRFIGNRSSGKQGAAIAAEAAARGAKVTLISTNLLAVPAGVEVVRVESAAEMAAAVTAVADEADIVVMAAAVADFRPVAPAAAKIKKDTGPPAVVLEPTTDILAALGARKRPDQVLVGFAAETSELRANAAAKLARKGADLIVANDVSQPNVGFEHDTNEVLILTAAGAERAVPLADKRTIAAAVVDAALSVRSAHIQQQISGEG
ncbi:MAG TPA: bifunctional phosphopantothenoylcysteine decarboxylase/phosphopantothenate--cysteine ligase CoaBC [Acidimicrobiales bacterium]|jgi:phosphopantothenoylcysteine decarboxylase/phosphopantothenate--cysteine ligase|nr:bifunctional phosphopantothenoylcysteine decarboxylase/phosphopantothenate--cysteine ligase CoaBC [Acidimicrobiales bacterium]